MPARPGYHLAQTNVARLVAPRGDPRVAAFTDNIARINGLAARMPGFVWVMDEKEDPAASHALYGFGTDDLLTVTVSVWDSPEALEHFVFNTLHVQFFRRKAEWFEVLKQAYLALWWVPEGDRPTLIEARDRLVRRTEAGDSDAAFGWDWMRAQGWLTTVPPARGAA
ncbi:DUF3291 domain-containing protein [Oceanicola sp. 22II-s10i]|uniref:DUF3291 domain-containing protein n=1 Tax=Oceanicola sp. 22II-s10i TaxID=1317116 RepID=UPI000B528E7F|nr:DUF3291 domain-containing protein [Oceanicola sp. 22II-s10i]